MFIGHFGVAFVAKRAAPRASLATLFAATYLVDIVWPALILIGAEHARIVPGITKVTPFDFYDYPISHSLLGGLAWALLFGLLYLRLTSYVRGAIVSGALVMSHWVLDVVSHRPDVPVLPGGPFLGLGLWNSVPLALAVEGLLFGLAVFSYIRQTYALDGIGRYGLGGLVVFLVAMQLGANFGPPPPSMTAVAAMTLAGVPILLGWARLVDRHRDLWVADLAPGPRRAGPVT
jgi:hypothetical protein